MSLSAQVITKIVARQSEPWDLLGRNAPLNQAVSCLFSDGVGAGQIDLMFADRRSLAAGQAEDLDLRDGSLPDPLCGGLVFARLKVAIVVAPATNPDDLYVKTDNITGGQGAKTGDGVRVRPGGALVWVATDAVGAAVVPAEPDSRWRTRRRPRPPTTSCCSDARHSCVIA